MLGTPTACWWREPVLSLFLRAQVTDCCSSPSGALQRHGTEYTCTCPHGCNLHRHTTWDATHASGAPALGTLACAWHLRLGRWRLACWLRPLYKVPASPINYHAPSASMAIPSACVEARLAVPSVRLPRSASLPYIMRTSELAGLFDFDITCRAPAQIACERRPHERAI